MASETKTQLKTYFETGDTPTQAQFENLIDSQINQVETSDQSVVSKVEFKKQAVPNSNTSETVITYTATPTFNFNNGHVQKMTLSGNITSFATSNESAGGFYMIWIVNDATPGRTVAAPTGWTAMADSDTHSTDANAINLYQFFTDPANTLKYYAIKNL